MRAALLTGYGRPLQLADVPAPVAGLGDAVVRVRACGICGSDWHVWNGDWRWRMTVQLPHVLGHELSGEVASVGDGVERFVPGDRVTLPFHLSCGACEPCLAGQSNICDRYSAIGFHLPGGFAEQVRVPAADRNLVHLPEGVSHEAAASLGCRYTSAFHGLERAGLRAGETVMVVGCGGLGLSVVQLAVAMGARVMAVDVAPANLGLAAALGARPAIAPEPEADALDAMRTLAPRGVDVAVDAVGTAGALALAVQAPRRGGRVLRLGLTGAEERGVVPTAVDDIVKRELTIVGAVGCPAPAFARLVDLVARGAVDPSALVSRTVRLDDVSAVLADMSARRQAGMAVWATDA